MFLSSLGCPVPCRKANIFIFDNIYTHFNKEELITDSGRLKEELNRLSKIIKNATKNSIIIINELLILLPHMMRIYWVRKFLITSLNLIVFAYM